MLAGQRNLAELSNSIFASLGVPGCEDTLALGASPGRRECLLLIDGLGAAAIEKYGDQFPVFAQLQTLDLLRSHFPSTTATNLVSMGTGVLPGVHGMLGYTVRIPFSGEPGRLLNALKWDERVDPLRWQQQPTNFERAMANGVGVAQVAAKRYEGSGFTRAALRGATYIGANNFAQLVEGATSALQRDPSFAYVYVNNVDHAGHEFGVGSDQWLHELGQAATLISMLIERLPQGTRLWVTADHGMINVEESIILGRENPLMEDVTLVGGEPRARHIYLREGSAGEAAALWREYLRGSATVYSKADAVGEEIFGGFVSQDSLDRMGDLIVVPHGGLILVDPSRIPQESSMVGHHGGVTETELAIPLLSAIV